MKKTPWLEAEPYRYEHPMASQEYGDDFGCFMIPGPCGKTLACIVSKALDNPTDEMEAWDHVSVSLKNRCPNWKEMQFIKEVFFDEEEAVMQLHPRASDYIDCHPTCLHMWRPTHTDIPMPPSIMVGPKECVKK